MMTQLKKMEKALLEAGKGLTGKEIGNSAFIRRDFYYFSKAFIEDKTAQEKMEPWSDNARLVCPCMLTKGRTAQTECCTAAENGLGLDSESHREHATWQSVWEHEVQPAPMSETGKRIVGEVRKVFCWCGKEFVSTQERDSHRATSSDDKRHGPMPHESPLIGGACIIVNLKTGNFEVSCQRLLIHGEGDETSSHGEAEMVTQAAIQITKRALSLSETDHIAFYTDNLSVVQGTSEYILATSKTSRLLKSNIRETLRRLKVAMNRIKSMGASLRIFHTLNDHHRPWWMDHQSLTCRLNRVADLAADEAARWEGVDSKGNARPPNYSFGAFAERRLSPPKTGGPVTLSRNRIVMGSDFRKPIRDVLNYKLIKYLGENTVQGSTARRVMLEMSDVQASTEVRNILPDHFYETVLRSLLYRERYTVPEIKAKYRELKIKSETIFSRCGGALAKLCSFCANLGLPPRALFLHAPGNV
jgi:hypothetical protein